MDKSTIVKLLESSNEGDNRIGYELLLKHYPINYVEEFKYLLHFIGTLETECYIYSILRDGKVSSESRCLIFNDGELKYIYQYQLYYKTWHAL